MKFNEIKTDLKGKSGIDKLSTGGHIYVGSSKNLYSRLKEHEYDLKKNIHNNEFLQKVCNKYGIDNLDIEILEFCNQTERIQKEAQWIKQLNADMNMQDPISKSFTPEVIEKISKNTKKAYAEGKGKMAIEKGKIECYDYLGNYECTYDDKDSVCKDLCVSQEQLTKALSGYKKGITLRGKRFRYSLSKVPVQKFKINPQYLGRYFDFYTLDENGNEVFAFDSVRNFYPFLAEKLLNGCSEIKIIPKLRKHCEPWNVSKK